MARRRAVIRRLPAVETLGSTTVICSDKTGTLTRNEMTVCCVVTPGGRYAVSGTGYGPDGALAAAPRTPGPADDQADAALQWCLRVGVLCNDASLTRAPDGTWGVVGDPTEGALLTLAAKAGLASEPLRARVPRLATVPFTSAARVMATVHAETPDLPPVVADDGDAGRPSTGAIVLVKGAVEPVLDRCAVAIGADGQARALDRDAVVREVDELARGGLRVLATAVGRLADTSTDSTRDTARDTSEPPSGSGESSGGPRRDDEVGTALAFAGLVAMSDPPRPAAIRAVRACHAAGVDVKMITGDHALTAAAIAARVGLGTGGGDDVVTGPELGSMEDAEFARTVERASVFARVSPEQKLALVSSLQANAHVVAVTGDGVNDAPALRKADIGVAMGRAGTEVAKEASDMVLTDDDFATIEAAVEEGRGVFDNLTKFIVWTLPTNVGEGLVILVAIVGGLVLPVLPVQILWINMTTAVLLGLMLAFEPKEAGIMNRPPRDPRLPLLTGAVVGRTLLVSALLVGGALWAFGQELAHGAGVAEARTVALNLFVVVEAFYLVSCRSLTRSAWRVGPFTNRWLLAGLGVQALAQVAITYVPTMNDVFGTAPIDAGAWLRILAVAVAVSVIVALDKRRQRGRV